jgi:hypothetical protein
MHSRKDRAARVHVPLASGQEAILDIDAYHDLRRQGISGRWFAHPTGNGYRYVKCQKGGAQVSVARLIVGAMPGEIVRYRNGDALNLLSSNLYVSKRPVALDRADRALNQLRT